MALSSRPLIIAHRGASAERPENTLAAFRRALALRVDGIELDVHVTRDGVPVVFHDADLRRLTGVRGRIASRTWRELRPLRVRGVEPIPRLVDVLRLTRGRCVVQIELKAGVPVAPVVRAVQAARASDAVILASFSAALVRDARRLAPAIPRMLISEGRAAPAALVRQLAACDAAGLSVNHRAICSAAWVRGITSRGFGVWSWTVNEAHVARQLAGWGVGGLLGDNPALLRAAV
ncbi:MAG: glycerophosphodiester phosphodiesterase [Candidatus Didemnitutus sp.]|nr:glycerophosphodiester phosphodiesterase [Candidatus Didemnitutus sp.]